MLRNARHQTMRSIVRPRGALLSRGPGWALKAPRSRLCAAALRAAARPGNDAAMYRDDAQHWRLTRAQNQQRNNL